MAKPKERFFRTTRDGQTVILDRAQGILYNEAGQMWDPVMSKWRDDPARKEPKKPDQLGQLGYIAASGGATALGTAAAGGIGNVTSGIGGLFGLGAAKPAVPAALSAAPAAAPAAATTAGTSAATGAGAGTGASAGGMAALGNTFSGMSALGTLAAAPAALATAYYTGTGINNAIKGQDMSLPEQAALALPTAGASFLLNEFNSGKDKDQTGRDAVRGVLKESGFLNDNYELALPDGNKFDLGKDGDAKLKNVDGSERRYFDVDFKDERAGSIVAALNPLAEILSGGNEKLKSDFAGYLTNAALSSGDPMANVQAIYERAGVPFTGAPAPQAPKPAQTKWQKPNPAATGGMASLGASAAQRKPVVQGNRTYV